MIGDDYRELEALQRQLMGELETYRNSGIQLAQNEKEYRMRLAIEELRERQKGTPVTIMGDICRGLPEIADLKCARDCAETMRDSSKEMINALKLRIRILDATIQRDWTSGGMQ